MSRITCLIIFSGSSARSTMSLMFARIKVLTRSKSPMMNLLSRIDDAKHSKPFHDNQARLPALQSASEYGVHAVHSRRELREAQQRNESQRNGPAKRVDRARPKVVEHKTECHYHKNPKKKKLFFRAHGHPPETIWRPRQVRKDLPGRKQLTASRSYPQSLRLLDRRLRRLRLRRFVADQPHFAKQLRHLHAGERFEERGHLRGNPGDVPGKLVSAGGIAIACGDDGHFVHLAERLAERAHHFRQSGDEFVEHGGLVVFLEGFRLHVHGFGFGFTLLEDDLGFGFTLRANRGGAAFGFGDRALTLGAGERFEALAFDFRLLQHGGDEFLLAARDFRFLHFHLRFTLHLLDTHGLFNHLLLHDVGFDFIRLVGGGLRFLGHFQVAGFLDVQVALRFGLLGQRCGLGRDALLVGLCFRNSRGPRCFSALDGDVAVGFGGGHFRVPLDARDVRPPHVGDVFVLVAYFLDREADDFQPHLAHVVGAGGAHAVADHFRLLDDLLDGELADDAAQVTFHHQANQGFALLWPLGEELLGSRQDRFFVVLHLDLCHGFDGYGDTLLRVQTLLRGDVERHQLQREIPAGLHHRKNQGAFSAVDFRPSHAVPDQSLIWPDFSIHLRDHDHDHQDAKYEKPGDDHYFVWQPEHKASFFDRSRLFVSSTSPRKPLLRELFPPFHIGDSFFVALDHHFGAFLDGSAVIAARSGATANSRQRENNLASAALPDRHADGPERAFHPVVFAFHRRVVRTHEFHHEAENHKPSS